MLKYLMDSKSIFVVLPAVALVLAVIFATFYHKYDTNRNLFQERNMTIGDLGRIGGNIISLQKDATGNIVWIVTGKWQFALKPASNDTGRNTTDLQFNSNITSQKADGLSINKLSLSHFTLKESKFTDKVAAIDGTVLLIRGGGSSAGENVTKSGDTIPLNILISNSRTIRISSGSDLFHKYFEQSPVYGNVPQRD
jgi:hypothetical protein